jgi:TATA-box binding protein (TBP) (component of TFIID and TFIIIB)
MIGKKRKRPLKIPRKRKKRRLPSYPKVDYQTPRLQNIVSVICSNTKFDHALFSRVMENYEYFKDKFAAASVRFTMPDGMRSTCLLYATGKVIVVGSTSELIAKGVGNICLHEVGKIREKKFVKNENPKSRYFYDKIKYVPKSRSINCGQMRTSNTVCKCDLESKKVYLNEIRDNNQKNAKYSPEAFPGAIYRGKWATYLLFESKDPKNSDAVALILGLSNMSNLPMAKNELDGIVDDSVKRKESMDIISRHIWELSNNKEYEKASHSKEEMVKFVEMERTRTKEMRKKIKNRKKFISTEIKRNYTKKNPNQEGNFENRLTAHYSFGKYVNTDKRIVDGIISDEVRETISSDDFCPRVDHLLSKFNNVY